MYSLNDLEDYKSAVVQLIIQFSVHKIKLGSGVVFTLSSDVFILSNHQDKQKRTAVSSRMSGVMFILQ